MTIIAKNGITYEVRTDNNNLEIEREDVGTGLRKVFVFQDLSIGNLDSGRKEAIFHSYDISPTGSRINQGRHNFVDLQTEFEAFINSDIWNTIKQSLIVDFLAKIEFTEIATQT